MIYPCHKSPILTLLQPKRTILISSHMTNVDCVPHVTAITRLFGMGEVSHWPYWFEPRRTRDPLANTNPVWCVPHETAIAFVSWGSWSTAHWAYWLSPSIATDPSQYTTAVWCNPHESCYAGLFGSYFQLHCPIQLSPSS